VGHHSVSEVQYCCCAVQYRHQMVTVCWAADGSSSVIGRALTFMCLVRNKTIWAENANYHHRRHHQTNYFSKPRTQTYLQTDTNRMSPEVCDVTLHHITWRHSDFGTLALNRTHRNKSLSEQKIICRPLFDSYAYVHTLFHFNIIIQSHFCQICSLAN
jgi:hypothetical protein